MGAKFLLLISLNVGISTHSLASPPECGTEFEVYARPSRTALLRRRSALSDREDRPELTIHEPPGEHEKLMGVFPLGETERDRRLAYSKNSAVYQRPSDGEKGEIEKLQEKAQKIEAESYRNTQAFVRKTNRLNELMNNSSRTAKENAQLAQLIEDLRYDYVVVGKGHTGVEAVRTIRRLSPNAKILIVGEEASFWTEINVSIPIVGDISGAIGRHGGPEIGFDQDGSIASSRKRHGNQDSGLALGTYITDFFERFLKDPNITVLSGKFFGQKPVPGRPDLQALTFLPPGWETMKHQAGSFAEAEPEFPIHVLVPSHRLNGSLNLGLGHSRVLPVNDKTGEFTAEFDDFLRNTIPEIRQQMDRESPRAGEHRKPPAIDGDTIVDGNKGRPVRDNLNSQIDALQLVLGGTPNSTQIKQDMARAQEHGRGRAVYVVTGFGDGAFAQMEALLEGFVYECCHNSALGPKEIAQRIQGELKGLKIYLIGKDMMEGGGWRKHTGIQASLELERYNRITAIMDVLIKSGSLEIIEGYAGAIDYEKTGTGEKLFTLHFQGPIPESANAAVNGPPVHAPITGVDRIYHNNGYQGSTEVLQRLYYSMNPATLIDAAPAGKELYRQFDFVPVYSRKTPGRLIALKIVDPKNPQRSIPPAMGNSGLLMAMDVAKSLGVEGKDVSDEQLERARQSAAPGSFLSNPANIRAFRQAIEEFNRRTIRMENIEAGTVRTDEFEFVVNPFGIADTFDATQEAWEILLEEDVKNYPPPNPFRSPFPPSPMPIN